MRIAVVIFTCWRRWGSRENLARKQGLQLTIHYGSKSAARRASQRCLVWRQLLDQMVAPIDEILSALATAMHCCSAATGPRRTVGAGGCSHQCGTGGVVDRYERLLARVWRSESGVPTCKDRLEHERTCVESAE
jgi:hypothetical protein